MLYHYGMTSTANRDQEQSALMHGRRRTESMVQRFSKTSIGEGFDLWDRDYLLGAMRFFLFKAETAPPFQVGICMDATGEILVQMEEYEDAGEQFSAAAAKYTLIQKPELAKLMSMKAVECSQGPHAALDQVTGFLAEQRAALASGGMTPALARIHAYQAELLLKTAEDGAKKELVTKAAEVARLACFSGWDRAHTAHVVLGNALRLLGRIDEAREEYAAAVRSNASCITALERHMDLLKVLIEEAADEARVQALNNDLRRLLDSAIALHPRSTLLRAKAFVLSETEGDAAALAFLDPLIQNPPPEEADAAGGVVVGETLATLLKAKAAILADGGNMDEALRVAEAALRESPSDDEAAAIVAEIRQAV